MTNSETGSSRAYRAVPPTNGGWKAYTQGGIPHPGGMYTGRYTTPREAIQGGIYHSGRLYGKYIPLREARRDIYHTQGG